MRGCQLFLQEIFRALKLCAAELDIAVCPGEIGTGLCDLLLPGATDQFVESCLSLPDGGFCLPQARAGPRVVLAEDELSGRYAFSLRDEDFEYRFVHFRDEFDAVGCKFADNQIQIVRVVA